MSSASKPLSRIQRMVFSQSVYEVTFQLEFLRDREIYALLFS